MNKMFLFLGFLMVVAVVSVSGCTSNTSQTNSTANLGQKELSFKTSHFSPATLTVKAGTTVKW
jgi:plastocyanin